MKRGSIDTQINRLRLFVTKDETKEEAITTNIERRRRKAACFIAEDETITSNLQELQARFANDWQSILPGITLNDPSIPFLSALCDEALVEVNTVTNRIRTVQTSLKRLTEFCTSHIGARDEECPTCGQEMPAESRVTRKQELGASLETLQQEQLSLSERLEGVRNLRDLFSQIEVMRNKSDDLCKQIAILNAEVESDEQERVVLFRNVAGYKVQLEQLKEKNGALLSEFAHEKEEREQERRTAESQLVQLRKEEIALQKSINDARQLEDDRQRAQGKLSVAKVHLRNAQHAHQALSTKQSEYDLLLANNKSVREAKTAQICVLDRLVLVLGARGIQNYVFQNVIKHLESITNSYLEVLAEGGILLSLQNNGADDDRIVKSVWVRSKERGDDDDYRERHLAQLSGGQWRRVSLALDFAFAELIRRRGVLRSNLMVMDEVLTHLDASGRESLGTVLRALVQGPGAFRATTSNTTSVDESADQGEDADQERVQRLTGALLGGGAYETVIVILQDLAAAELSEAFDHVDVVVKESDRSRVVLDGDEV